MNSNLSFFFHANTQQGEAKKALQVLQKPNVPTELQYKFAPDLIMLDAYETVESWMTTKSLNPRKLIPAMMRYSSEPHAKNETHEVIKYLEYCVHRLQNEDPGIHNLLLSLYAKKEDESALLRFLECKFGKGQPGGPEFFYDPKYALRLCLKEKRMRACVHIYSMMSMHEEAVALALQVDPELAMAEADKVEDDEDLRKKLWLMIAKHVIEQEKGTKRENIRKAIAFLKETDGLLKIEDILPFFPDFALIDDFKKDSGKYVFLPCSSEYNSFHQTNPSVWTNNFSVMIITKNSKVSDFQLLVKSCLSFRLFWSRCLSHQPLSTSNSPVIVQPTLRRFFSTLKVDLPVFDIPFCLANLSLLDYNVTGIRCFWLPIHWI
ncbi:hypothetical protein MTR67_022501 [Solanum verrucosum]|uniref:Uncharacterized protein n=1 Tax=Solanum verrucosum TaxID=315347 RepID=A0AAF0QTI0_SOLVR|nr:hypothetical protein MTR67_022501 [Solanum verrucosum]